jgi:hypothetical protein
MDAIKKKLMEIEWHWADKQPHRVVRNCGPGTGGDTQALTMTASQTTETRRHGDDTGF